MSNEFEVHNFYNHNIEELEEIKNEFLSIWNQALNFKKAYKDLGKLSKKKWYKKHDCVEDSKIYKMAEKEYGKCSK